MRSISGHLIRAYRYVELNVRGRKDLLEGLTDSKRQERIAYHEAGHVLAGYYSANKKLPLTAMMDPLEHPRLSLSEKFRLRMQTGGVTHEYEFPPELLDLPHHITECYGGIAAEEAVYGAVRSPIDVLEDVGNAWTVGLVMALMEEKEPVALSIYYSLLKRQQSPVWNQWLAASRQDGALNRSIEKSVSVGENRAVQIIGSHRAELDNVAEALLTKRNLIPEDFTAILEPAC